MATRSQKLQKLKQKLYNKRRLVILNEDTFEETFSLQLNLMNVFVVASISSIFLIGITTYIIAFTPLREYIPGYASSGLKKETMELALKSDSLQVVLDANKDYITSIKKVLLGKVEYAKLRKDSIIEDTNKAEVLDVKATVHEKELREQVAKEDKYNVFDSAKPKISFVLFAPTFGKIIKNYNPNAENYAIEIAIAKNTPIKAVATGTIVFADWTPTNGYVMIIRHQDGLLSVYKNISIVTKTERETVKAGEVIALAGDTDNQNSGNNLYFELWKDGFPINPTQFINF